MQVTQSFVILSQSLTTGWPLGVFAVDQNIAIVPEDKFKPRSKYFLGDWLDCRLT